LNTKHKWLCFTTDKLPVMVKTKTRVSKKKDKGFSYEWRRIGYFFQWFTVDNSKEQLWEMLKLALTSEDEAGNLKERSDMLNFYEHAIELIENIHVLYEEKTRCNPEK